jgi:hypothetical protein
LKYSGRRNRSQQTHILAALEKIEVFMLRVERGEKLFCEDDCQRFRGRTISWEIVLDTNTAPRSGCWIIDGKWYERLSQQVIETNYRLASP